MSPYQNTPNHYQNYPLHPGNRAEGGPDSGDEGRRQGHPLLLSEGTLRLGEVTYVQGWVSCVHCVHEGHFGGEI